MDMVKNIKFDYYYGLEAEQFSFLRVPKLLIKENRFKGLSSDAKLLYGLMLDRMALSLKNNWLDDANRAYIYYTIDEIMDDLGCSRGTCIKIMAELDSKKGIGLIEKKRQGLGKPDIIYVKNFVTASHDEPVENDEKKSNNTISTEVQNSDFLKSKNRTSRSSNFRLQEVQNLDSSNSIYNNIYNNINNTDINYTNPIYPINHINTESKSDQKMDRMDVIDKRDKYMELIRRNIAYEHHMRYDKVGDRELYDELYEIICDVVCVERKTVRIGGEDYPYRLVKSKFLKLNDSHLEYVILCMKDVTTKIGNIKAYLTTALYNAPLTMDNYYTQLVQHDMYGGGWQEKGIV